MHIDLAFERFSAIVREAREIRDTIISEQDARMKIVNRVLHEVLGWPLSEIQTEERAGRGYSDYRLVINRSSKVVVEAKREATGFELASRDPGSAFLLRGAVFNTAAKEGILQAVEYSAHKQAELAVVTNGSEWIVFRANRLGDGSDILDGKGFVFGSLEAIEAKFALFFDLLSRPSVNALRFRGLFRIEEGLPATTSSFAAVLRPPESRNLMPRPPSAADLDRVTTSFFHRLTAESDDEMVLKCFVVTRESEMADRKLSRISEDLVGSLRRINSATGDELVNLIRDVQLQQKNRFVLLIGNKGAGKSTFIDRFFRFVLPKEIAEGLVVIRINLAHSDGNENAIISWLNSALLTEAEKQLYADGNPGWDESVGAMFWDEYLRWAKSTMRPLYESNKAQFKIEFGRHIEEIREKQPQDYVRRILSHIARSRKKVPCLVLDNTDHFTIGFQERVFQYARSIYERDLCLFVLPITDKTSWQLSKQGALQSFENESLFLPTPAPARIIERRVLFITEKLRSENRKQSEDYFFGRGIRLRFENIAAFAASLSKIFIESRSTADWVGALANHDIRRVLELTRDILSSPHIPIEDMLKAHIAGSALLLPDYKFKNAVIKGRYDIYPVNQHSFVQNLYDLILDPPTSPLVASRLLQFVRDVGIEREADDANFTPIPQITDYFRDLGFDQLVTLKALDQLLKTGLIWNYDPTVADVERASKVEITPAGKLHLIWSTADEDYIKAMRDVTHLRSRDTYEGLLACSRGPQFDWRRAFEEFADYLITQDAIFCKIPAGRVFDGQRSVTYRITQLRKRVRSYGTQHR